MISTADAKYEGFTAQTTSFLTSRERDSKDRKQIYSTYE